MSRALRRHYRARGVTHAVLLEQHGAALRARLDDEPLDLEARRIRDLPHGVELILAPGGRAVVVRERGRVFVALGGRTYTLEVADERHDGEAHAPGDDEPFAISPMTGVVLAVNVAPGDSVDAGAVLFVIEAMKMEFAVEALRAVVIDEVRAAPGDRVDISQVLVTYRAESEV